MKEKIKEIFKINIKGRLTDKSEIETEEIVNSCREGKEWGQKILYDRYKNAFYNLAFRICGSETEAEHILQDSFLDIFKSIGSFKGESGIYTWMRTIVVRKAVKNKNLNQWNWTSFEDSALPEQPTEPPETDGETLLKALHQLPEGFRTVMILFYLENYTHEQIAAELGINKGTSKSQLHRAKQRLKEIILKNEKS